MAAGVHSVWALDVGNSSLKALRLRAAGEKLEVIALDYIEHRRILSSSQVSEAEKPEIIRETLHTFVERNELGKDEVAVSVPGQTSFARFIKLPPVEPKRIPEIIKFEAIQQIPFDINEVEWDWQLMPNPDSPDTEVGIFAIKNELISRHLESFSAENIRVSTVQMSPMALYNYAFFDRPDAEISDNKAVIILDMGTDNTNLVICTSTAVWQRCILLGGNSFTNAIETAFKLNFEKAEKLKRSAPMSKYARQIFHAMKPVFTDFGSEVQRSLGYYGNANKNISFSKILLLGGGFRLQGLSKYLQQVTQLRVVKPDAFEKLASVAEVSSAKLHDNITDFGIVYGLGLQGLGRAKIESNLLPGRIARSMMWARKSKFFYIAAAVLLVVNLLAFLKASHDNSVYNSKDAQGYRRQVQNVISDAREAENKLSKQKDRDSGYQKQIDEQVKLFDKRDVIASLNETLIKCFPDAKNNPSQKQLYSAFKAGDVKAIEKIPRKQRKQVFITSLKEQYYDSLAKAPLAVSGQAPQSSRSRSSRSTGTTGAAGPGGAYDMPGMPGMPGMMGPAGGRPSYSAPSTRGGRGRSRGRGRGRSRTPSAQPKTENDGPGFVVIIEGYTPYHNVDELMDPAGVGDDRSKWGIVTRLMNLDAVVDGNCPFKLFRRGSIKHFKRQGGVVDLSDPKMPVGIGIKKTIIRVKNKDLTAAAAGRTGSARSFTQTSSRVGMGVVTKEDVLIDPMTNEEISRTFDLDNKSCKICDAFGRPVFIDRDNWFRLKFQLLWKNGKSKKPR